MMETRIERFGVVLPEGSLSQKIDEASKAITAQLNCTPLTVNKLTWERAVRLQEVEVDRLTGLCRQTCGNTGFRPNASADCIKEIQKLGIELTRLTEKGATQCDKEVLESIQERHPLIGQIMDARNGISVLSQLKKWEEFAEAGTVQTTWDQNGTPMGRYTAAGPNLQNRVVPIRETVEAPGGWTLLSMDLGSAEYVTWASLADDPEMKACFRNGDDFHEMMGGIAQEANPALDLHGETVRQFGKTLNFATLYLMRALTLAQKLGVSVEVAEAIQKAYFAKAARAKEFMDAYLKEVQETGVAYTKFGRRRELPELKTAKVGSRVHNEALKTAWHHLICGTTAEILKLKTFKVLKGLQEKGFGPQDIRPALQMHDEIVFVVRDERMEEIRPLAEELFTKGGSSFEWYVPHKVTLKTGRTWGATSK